MVDRSIERLLEYAAMSKSPAALAALVCATGLLAGACAGRAPVTTVQPFPQAARSSAEPPPTVVTAPRRPPVEPVGPARTSAAAVQPAQPASPESFEQTPPEPAAIDQLRTITTESPAPTPATTDAVVEDLATDAPGLDIPLNARVLSYVELFTGRLKTYLESGLNRGAPYLPMIQEVFASEGLPVELAYVPLVESAFKTNAVSRAKATGMWQFMHGTALENGLKHDWYIDERADPEKATRAAARYLKTLYGMFGDWSLALASYNGGPGRVQRALRQSGHEDFWTLSATSAHLPRETRDYVPLVMAAAIIARNPDQYGMTLDPASPAPIERVAVPAPVDLRRVSSWLGIPLRELQDLNPELRRWTTPLRATEYELRVPEGGAEVVRARLDETDPALLAPVTRHTVKKGETLLGIAKKLKVTRADLAEANYLSASARLREGQLLIVPRAPAFVPGDLPATIDRPSSAPTLLAATTGKAEPAVVDAAAVQAKPAPRRTAPASTASKRSTDVKVVHRVKSGETLTSIARRYSTTVASLKQWNKLRTSTIKTGQRLTIVSKRSMATD